MKFVVVLLGASLVVSAQPACETLRHHGDPDAKACYQRLTKSSDPAIQAEGFWGLRDYKAANDAFRAAVAAHPKDPKLRVRWGRLYLETPFKHPDPSELFKEALDIDKDYAPALLGMALVAADSFEGRATELAERALKSDPKLVEARELIARMALEDNNPEKAAAEAKKALEMSPEALDAMAILATIDWLNDKQTSEWTERIFRINPVYGKAYETAGHFFVINRRYDEGIRDYRKALEIDPTLQSARSELGINLMRFGREDEARTQLEAGLQRRVPD